MTPETLTRMLHEHIDRGHRTADTFHMRCKGDALYGLEVGSQFTEALAAGRVAAHVLGAFHRRLGTLTPDTDPGPKFEAAMGEVRTMVLREALRRGSQVYYSTSATANLVENATRAAYCTLAERLLGDELLGD